MDVKILNHHFKLVNETKQEINLSFQAFKNSCWNIKLINVDLCKTDYEFKVHININADRTIKSHSTAPDLYEAYYKAYDNLSLWEGKL